jgi:hypothetical protein
MTTTTAVTVAQPTTDEVSAPSALPSWLGAPLLLAGPVATARLLIANQNREALHLPGALAIALVLCVGALWSPFGLSIPSAFLQFARAAALPKMGASSGYSPMNLVRIVILTPYLAIAKSSQVRTEVICSLIGWAVGLYVIAPYLGGLHRLGL